MDWYLAAPFIHRASDRWLTAFVPEQMQMHFRAVPAAYQHDGSRSVTKFSQWADYLSHGTTTWNIATRSKVRSGILTCYPQLPAVIGLRKRLSRRDVPLVAWDMNLGTLHRGARQRLAKISLRAVNRFIVHSRLEVKAYSEWVQLEPSRFLFVPLQRATEPITIMEDERDPFVLSMGSAHRDYRLLFAVLEELRYRTIVVAGSHAVVGLRVPANVTMKSGLSLADCNGLVQRARLSVIPVANQLTASGQRTLLDAMMFGRPVIVTHCPGSIDYVQDGVDAMLVTPDDHEHLKETLSSLWNDAILRQRLGQAARKTANQRFSDEVIGKVMGDVLSEVAREQ